MLQARRLGKQLLVGIHSDEEILENKGPTVMTLTERSVALKRWILFRLY
jgi:ethanolamine-phosphate cytidylyltransferase